tara:strand:- start:274 stop:729 length:456 start_codon:yes stop_codon:yes gene_type:complete
MYIPDWSIVKRVKEYDKNLFVKWLDYWERWAVMRYEESENNLYEVEKLVFMVENSDGSYRALDGRVLEHLKEIDLQRLNEDNLKDRLRDLEEHNEENINKKEKEAKNDIEDITKEIAPVVRREMQEDFGTRNIPKEDVREQLVSRYGEEVL